MNLSSRKVFQYRIFLTSNYYSVSPLLERLQFAYGVMRGDGENTMVVRGLWSENRGFFAMWGSLLLDDLHAIA